LFDKAYKSGIKAIELNSPEIASLKSELGRDKDEKNL
jgi:hypothetical protein